MANELTTPTPAKKRRGWLRILIGTVAMLFILFVVAYFVLTSSWFLKGVVLPRASKAIGADVTVSRAVIHPFSEIELSDLKVQSQNQPPLLAASEVRVRYHLWDILRGNLRVDEITLDTPSVELVANPDGSSNLDPLLKSSKLKPSAATPRPPTKPSRPMQIDLAKVTVNNASIVRIQNFADGRRDVLQLTNVNITLTDLKNGQSAKLQLDAALSADKNPSDGATGRLAAEIKGSFQFALTPDLKPGSVNGEMRLLVSQADGAFTDFSALSAVLECDATPTEIKNLNLHFQKSGAPLGEFDVGGPLDLAKMEGQLQVSVRGIDQRLLNLAGAASGIDFGSTTINSTNEIGLMKSGAVIAATGGFSADKFQVTRAGLTTPTLDFTAHYAVTVDTVSQTAQLRELTLAGNQNGRALLSASLSQPMILAWGSGAGQVGDSALQLTVTNLNLADWQPFLGSAVSGGDVNLTLRLLSQQAGQQLGFDVNSQINDLVARVGSNQTFQATMKLQAQGQAQNFRQFKLSQYELQILRQDAPLMTASGSGNYNLGDASAQAQFTLRASLAGLLQAFPQPGASFSSGTIDLTGSLTQTQNTQTVVGRLVLADFTGQFGKNSFSNFGSTVNLDVRRTPEQIQINQFAGALTQGANSGGNFSLAGTVDPAQKTAQLTANLSGFNQDGLRPFLEPLLAGKKLVSIALNGSASVQYATNQSSAIQADVQVTNLVVNDPAGQIPTAPLSAGLRIDTALQKTSADIRHFQFSLTPTDRAQNQIELQGQVDFARPQAIRGNLKLSSESLDLTRYYDLFAGPKSNSQLARPSPTASAAGDQEPPPITLPTHDFTVTAGIGRIYLREIAITNFQTTVKLETNRVTINPLQFGLNGAPVNVAADVGLDVPGYNYKVSLDAGRVPLAPLVDSFLPDLKGQLGGTLTAHAQISGEGIKGASLQKNLSGQFSVGATNLNLSVINIHSAILKSVINVVATIPELLHNPESAIVGIFGSATGTGGGLMNELQQSPIERITARGQAGSGRIELEQASVQSGAFEADAPGEIVLAPVLTNSTIHFPVTISVSQSIAKQLNLTAANSAGGAGFVALPQFLTMTGTLGDPQKKINRAALVGLTVKSTVGGLLGQPTNAPSPVGNLLNQLLKRVH